MAPLVGDVLVFQTGRWYTEQGQRIAAAALEGGGIAFYDIDRMITGVIPMVQVDEHGLRLNRDDVMWAYDHSDKIRFWEFTHGIPSEVWDFLKAQALTAPPPKR